MDNFGTGVSRVLSPQDRSLLQVIWQQGKPPCDAELNLMQQLAEEWDRTITLRGTPSGWIGGEVNLEEVFQTNVNWSNWFKFGRQTTGESQAITWAVVNGWLVPVTATLTGLPPGAADNDSTWNKITLDPPPSSAGETRIDYVFLEVWKALVSPSPSSTNKPAYNGVYPYGNVESGRTAIADDIQDPALGIETTKRVQLQYRIRVVTGLVGLSTYPDGFDPSFTMAQGAALAPTSWTFTNMRTTLGDPGLWRAGDGSTNTLGTVDGYVYAVPLCAVFRRNSQPWNGEPSPNLNGSFSRNPTVLSRAGIKTFTAGAPTLLANITATDMTVSLSTASNIPLPAAPSTPALIRIGDELLEYQSITGTTMALVTRGARGTRAEAHKIGDQVKIVALRPDGLFADQIALTDILDLRHVVNTAGFDYTALLKTNLDKLLRGSLRTSWKYTGASGVAGVFVNYQDYIGSAAPPVPGADKIDSPDNIRQVFSDAATTQRVTAIVKAPGTTGVYTAANVTWTLGVTVQANIATVNQLNPGDSIKIPITTFQQTLPASDQDQVRFLFDGWPTTIEIRIDGTSDPVPAGCYSVTPATPGAGDDLTITLNAGFPSNVQKNMYITFHVMYGAGRGISRRALALHNISYYNPGPDVMVQQEQGATNNVPLRTNWSPLWAKYLNTPYRGVLPVTSESFADLGSKTVILSPFRRIVMPTTFTAMDGSSLWHTGAAIRTGTNGSTSSPLWSNVFNDGAVNFTIAPVIQQGDRLVITGGSAAGDYAVIAVATTQLTLDKNIAPDTGPISYEIYRGEGLMPLKTLSGAAKWAQSDPLGMFSGQADAVAARKNAYVTLPRHLAPTWGEVWTPIQHKNPDTGTFNEGVNFLVISKKGAAPPNSEKNYVSYANGTPTYAIFTTWNFNLPEAAAAYNTPITWGVFTMAGMRHFNDVPDISRPTARNLGRKGLELPPYYGIARLYAVYEAEDFQAHGSTYDPATREYVGGGATNLLRQNLDGPTFWIEKDADGDSTFILNADALDLSKSTYNPIASFDAGHYVIEANIFGFDRGSFDLDQEFRMVLTQERTQNSSVSDRTLNVGTAAPAIDGPECVIPAPPSATDVLLVNYSRTPYQGDPFGTQSLFVDHGYYAGPLTTINAYNLVNTDLDENNLTRANEKPLEVLAEIAFATTLGTGRMSGPIDSAILQSISNIGGEDLAAYPPTALSDPRPAINSGVMMSTDGVWPIATEYLGCTERLPLGSLMRDKDFRGGKITGYGDIFVAPLVYTNGTPGVFGTSLQAGKRLETTEMPLDCATPASGQPGEILVAVDGNPNVNQYLAFRTFRGGSVFSASGGHPGGDFACSVGLTAPPSSWTNVLAGKAMLVRNVPTFVGTQEVSYGDELMMLVITHAKRCIGGGGLMMVANGTNGTGEGYSAAELYRISGRPLLRDNVRYDLDPATVHAITLARKTDFNP
jgi:hypothetical protein